METKTFSIKQVSDLTGVSQNRIREWHEKELLPEVHWIEVGTRQHRRFTEDDIRVIKKIDELQEKGYLLWIAAQMAAEQANK